MSTSPTRRLLAPALVLPVILAASCWRGPVHDDVRVGGPIPEFRRPCLKEIPTLNAIADDSSARVVTIAIDEGGAAVVEPFVAKHDIRYTVLLGDRALFQRFNGWAIPYTLVLDSSLRIVSFHRGYVSLRSLERDLRRAES